jgi:hypothetical protein
MRPVLWILILSLAAPASQARDIQRIIKQIDDVRVQVVLTESVFGRMYLEIAYLRDHPDLCTLCERVAMTQDSLVWVPVGIGWERDGGLLIDPVIGLKYNGKVYQSVESWVGRQTDRGLVTVRTPAKIPTGWECEEDYPDWKGTSVYVAFPRSLYPPGGGWPLPLRIEEVEDAEIRVNSRIPSSESRITVERMPRR